MGPILKASPGNPVPENHIAGTFRSHDGLDLRYAIFRSGSNAPRGTIVIHQGRNESIEKYFETIGDLNAMGLWVASFDWRGQGGSPRLLRDPRRGHVRHFSDYERDVDTFLEHVVLPDAKLPFFILAHSMGSLITMSAAPRLANRIERMVLLAPFLGIAGEGRRMLRIRYISWLASRMGLGFIQLTRDLKNIPFDENFVSSDPARYRRNQAIVETFPELGIGPPTARWLREMIDAIDRVATMEHLGRINVPALILAPTGDRVVPYSEMEELSKKFRAARLIPIHGASHEILHDRDLFRAQAMAAIGTFIPGADTDPLVLDQE